MLSLDDYKKYYYEHKRLIDGQYCPDNKLLTNRKLEVKYDKYIKKQEKIKEKYNLYTKDEKWEKVLQEVWIRDNGKCRLYSILTEEEKKIIDLELFSNDRFTILRGAHYLSRARYPELVYEPLNVFLLYNYFHSRLDNNRNPLTGKYFEDKSEWQYWWDRIRRINK